MRGRNGGREEWREGGRTGGSSREEWREEGKEGEREREVGREGEGGRDIQTDRYTGDRQTEKVVWNKSYNCVLEGLSIDMDVGQQYFAGFVEESLRTVQMKVKQMLACTHLDSERGMAWVRRDCCGAHGHIWLPCWD